MRKFVLCLIVCTLSVMFSFSLYAQDRFDRGAVIPAEPLDVGGFGNVVAGVDFDGDGKLEIYTVNNDWHDVIGGDLTPRIYKYEQNELGKWEIVWQTDLNLFFQNTWPAMAAADLDNDGKMEIVWGPVNNTGSGSQPNPERIVVFESAGDGSDVMGVADGTVAYRPNAQWTITAVDNANSRPFRWLIHDIDEDGTDEIVAGLRAGDDRIQIYSVDDIPDTGDSTETWTLEFSGTTGTNYDCFILDSTFYGIQSSRVTSVTWSASGDSFRVGEQAGVVPNGSWYSATVVDLDGDLTDEVLVASWNASTSNIYLVQRDADTLKTTLIADVPDAANRLYGGAAGDLDNDGLIDFVFGTRQATPNGSIYRLEYQGGIITDPLNYELTLLDSEISEATQYDVIRVANMDDDPEDEIIYTGTPRGQGNTDLPQPLVILDKIPGNQPIVRNIGDVPNDQGKQVRVRWLSAFDDVPNGASTITEYSVWRKINPALAKRSLSKTMKVNNATWEQVNVTKAVQMEHYAAVVPTLADSVEGGGVYPPWSVFGVTAHTDDPTVIFMSFPNRGFSVDNLIPAPPANFSAKEIYVSEGQLGTELTWDASVDEDFDYFAVYKSQSPGINPKTATPLATLTKTQFVDSEVTVGETYYYAIAAFDFNNNQSDAKEVNLLVTGVAEESLLPTEYALDQNYPNPFNPATTINFSVKESGHVSIKIYSTLGKEVATITDKSYERGRYSLTFNAKNIASGVYFYVLKAKDVTFKKKMSVLK